MLRRLAALAFAGFVLAVAFAVRADRDGGAPDPPISEQPGDALGGPPAENPYEVFERGDVSLLCVEELRKVCADLASMNIDVRTEAAWSTVDRLRDGGELRADAWLTVRPFDQLAAERPAIGGVPFGDQTEVLARSPIVLTGPLPAIEALRADCPDAVTRVACATGSERAGVVALADPRSSALGSLALTTLAYELGADGHAGSLDDVGIAAHVHAVAGAARRTQSPFQDAERIGGRTLALTAEAELVERLAASDPDEQDRDAERFAVDYPIDVRAVEVIAIAGRDFRRSGDLDRVLRSRGVAFDFERAGFVTPGFDPYLLSLSVFADRPAVRTDLPWVPSMITSVRAAAG